MPAQIDLRPSLTPCCSSVCSDIQFSDATLRSVERTFHAANGDGRKGPVDLGMIWSRAAAFAEIALRPCHRDGDRLVASTLTHCKLPIPSFSLLGRVPGGKLGGSAVETLFFNTLRQELWTRLAEMQKWPVTADPAAEVDLAIKQDKHAMQHMTVLLAKLGTMGLQPTLQQKFIAELIADWRTGALSERYRDQRPEALVLRNALLQLENSPSSPELLKDIQQLAKKAK